MCAINQYQVLDGVLGILHHSEAQAEGYGRVSHTVTYTKLYAGSGCAGEVNHARTEGQETAVRFYDW